ncbi:RAI1 like PD-XK nuclease-domain-containing protein [Immersiella caudata]|uniref:Decapping nuclease n=1 Tax=Immersiella caudata TaxID=314043 RepID=A0AA39X4B9_9PEZI|nr:RAI1 like PD-XK nuclease-domain-containing protein [Immersiella caudata]
MTAAPAPAAPEAPEGAASFRILPLERFEGESEPVKRPREFACFSYDENHQFHLGDRSLKWYYDPRVGADLSKGFDQFVKHDDSIDEHLDSLLETIANHEKETGKAIDANLITWRGMMTKLMAAPYENRDGFEMNATLYQGCIFIEEDHSSKQASRRQEHRPARGKGPTQEMMQFWGYKFETLCTMPAPWGDTSREFIEGRENHTVNNKEQYCSVVRTGIGKTTICLGGEVDCIWDYKPKTPGAPIKWVELKTSAAIRSERDEDAFERKLLKFWIQSFLLGVPKIIIGFRSYDGKLLSTQEFETESIPATVQRRARPYSKWDSNVCVNFANAFLEWLRETITEGGVWRIRRLPKSQHIEAFKFEEAGHGDIITENFTNWRTKLSLGRSAEKSTEPAEMS